MAPLAVVGWRLGLGWLLGRRRLLLTTLDGTAVRRSLVPYRFHAGNVYLPGAPAPWAADLARNPRATVQAHPGPLGVRRRDPTSEERAALGGGPWIVLEPTADTVPLGVEPDLLWVWGLLAVALGVVAARRAVTP